MHHAVLLQPTHVPHRRGRLTMMAFINRTFNPLRRSGDVAVPSKPPNRAAATSHYVTLAVLAQLFSASAFQPCLHSHRPRFGSNWLRSFTPTAFPPRALVLREKTDESTITPNKDQPNEEGTQVEPQNTFTFENGLSSDQIDFQGTPPEAGERNELQDGAPNPRRSSA